MRELLAETVERILADLCTPAVVRAAEAGTWPQALWRQIEDAGLLRALVPERDGGAGLGWREALPMLVASGRHAAPVPLAEAIGAHALGAVADRALPEGVPTLAAFAGGPSGARLNLRAPSVPFARHATWVVGTLAGPRATELIVMKAADASSMVPGPRLAGDDRCELAWTEVEPALRAPIAADVSAGEVGAALRAAQIAGGIGRVLDLAVQYAGEREQFGRPIGKFQAIQQQLAVLGQLAAASAMAAELACDTEGTAPDAMRVACAKARASEAAAGAAAIAHAVHDAIGVTEEHDLQLYTRRLWAWRLDFGSETYWAEEIGRRVLREHRSAWQQVIDASAAR
jgi:acyl-CoA dehydrogenase